MSTINLASSLFVVFLMNFLISQHGYNAENIKNSILDNIKNDANICSTSLMIQKTKYIEPCEKINYTDKIINSDESADQLLCYGLYDDFFKICHYDSLMGKEGISSVLTNESEFHSTMTKIYNDTEIALKLCLELSNRTSPLYDKTRLFVDKLHSELKNPMTCIKMCFNPKTQEPNPLCAVMQLIDRELKIIGDTSESENAKKTPKNLINVPRAQPEPSKAMENNQKNSTHQLAEPVGEKLVKLKSKETKEVEKTTKIVDPTTFQVVETKNEAPSVTDTGKKAKIEDKNHKKQESSDSSNVGTTVNDGNNIQGQEVIDVKFTTTLETIRDDIAPDNPDGVVDVPQSQDSLSQPENNPDQDNDEDFMVQTDEDNFDQKENLPKLTTVEKDDDIHFFGFVTVLGIVGICGCLIYHHKQKILAMILEGRRSRGGRGRRRPSTASYRKLDCNLEEAVTSQCNANVTHVIY